MALHVDTEWITSDRCPQVAKAVPIGGWVLSWCSGRYTEDQAITAMTRAERGDLAPAAEREDAACEGGGVDAAKLGSGAGRRN